MQILAIAAGYPQVWGTPFLLLFALYRYWSKPQEHRRNEWFTLAVATALPANVIALGLTNYLSRLTPVKLDAFAFRVDGLLGFQPSFVLGQLIHHHLWLYLVCSFVYGAMPLTMIGVFAAYLWRTTERETLMVAKVFVLNLFLAVPIYLVVPVCGPSFAFPHFPSYSPDALMVIDAAPNGIPSVHFSTALLISIFAWRWPLGRWLGIANLLLTALATLGSGQHYLIDLVLAVPYALGIRAAFKGAADSKRLATASGN